MSDLFGNGFTHTKVLGTAADLPSRESAEISNYARELCISIAYHKTGTSQSSIDCLRMLLTLAPLAHGQLMHAVQLTLPNRIQRNELLKKRQTERKACQSNGMEA